MKSLLKLLNDPEIGKPFPDNYELQIGQTINFWDYQKWVVVEKREKYYVLWSLEQEYAGYTTDEPLSSSHVYAGWSNITEKMRKICKIFRGPY